MVLMLPCYGQKDNYLLQKESFREPVTALNVSSDGHQLLAGFQDGSFSILEINSLDEILKVENAHLKAVYAIEMAPKKKYILTAGFNTISIWSTEGIKIGSWKSHPTTIWNVDISSDGKYAVSSEFNKTFKLWDANSGEIIQYMRGHDDVTMAVAISPDSKLIASGSNDRTIKIWDIETRQPMITFHGPTKNVYDVKFSPDGKKLAVASNDNTIRIYDLVKKDLVHILKGHRDFVIDVEFSPKGYYLATASADQIIFLWDVETGEKIYAYLESEDALLDIVFHPDGKSFFSSTLNGSLSRWAVDREIFVLKYYEELYRKELSENRLFDARREGESKKDFESRMTIAEKKREEIILKYYQKYLSRYN
jgi:WD40 repeat protein